MFAVEALSAAQRFAKTCWQACRGNRVTFNPGEMNFPRFTAWLGNNSASTKQRRVVGELTTKLLAAGVVCDRANLRLQYLPALRSALTHPLVADGADGIDAVVQLMQSYLISRCAHVRNYVAVRTCVCRRAIAVATATRYAADNCCAAGSVHPVRA